MTKFVLRRVRHNLNYYKLMYFPSLSPLFFPQTESRVYPYSTTGVIKVPNWLWRPLLPQPPPPPPPSLEQESLQIAALDRWILRDCTGILSSIFVVRTNNGQDLYILLSKTLYWKLQSHIKEQTTLTRKKYNKDATRGTFRQVPTRRIPLSFVKCAYSDLRDVFFFHSNFRGLKWIPLWKRMAPNFKTTTLAHCRLSLFDY